MKLPNVYANKIDKNINNNSDYYRGEIKSKECDLSSLRNEFDNKGFTNRLKVRLELRDGNIINEKLVLCKSDGFITINNKKILFKDIVNYEIKK